MVLLAPLPGWAAPSVEIGYVEEAEGAQGPGHFASDFLRAAEIVVADSGIAAHWVALPPRRLERGVAEQPGFCVGGAGITPARKEIGNFSRPFAYDYKLAIVALKERQYVLGQVGSFADLAADPRYRFLGYEGMNYGPSFTPQLNALGERISYAPRTLTQMLDMLSRHRADFGVMSMVYVRNHLAQKRNGEDFVVVGYADMHRDFQIGFLCSKQTPAPVLDALNAAIQRQAPALKALFPDLFEEESVSGATR